MGWLADRYRRPPIIAIAAAVFAVFVFMSGLAVNAFTLFLARFGVGVAKSSTTTVHPSLIADTYPIGVRGRISAATMGSGLLIGAISPALVGGIATLAGGAEGWRWAFFILGIPALVLVGLRVPDPRGAPRPVRDEGRARRGHRHPAHADVGRVGVRRASSRSAPCHMAMLAFAAIGFGLFTAPILQSLYVEERVRPRRARAGPARAASAASSSSRSCRSPRGATTPASGEDPAKALRLVGLLILPVAVVVPIQYSMPNAIVLRHRRRGAAGPA